MNIWQRSSTPKSSNKTLIAGAAALFAAFVTALLIGPTRLDLAKAIGQLFGGNMGTEASILVHVRLPRALAATLAGAALAVSGATIQSVLNNAMASPSIIGVNAGAGFGVTLLSALAPAAVTLIPWAAFAGATITCLMIYLIAAKTGAGRVTITLTGIAVSSLLTALMSGIKAVFPDTAYNLSSFSVGGFSAVSIGTLTVSGSSIVLCLILSIIFAKKLDVLSLGEDTAHSLGMNVRRTRLLFLVLAGALAGLAVSFAGLLGFVGLTVPHIMRRFVGGRHSRLVPACALFGGTLTLVCDILARVIFAPYELPTGILLALIGGPFFIVIIFSSGSKKIYD